MPKMGSEGGGENVLHLPLLGGSDEKNPLSFEGSVSGESKSLRFEPPVSLTFRNITYTVKGGGGKSKDVLREISGYVRGGELLALLGPSGAGKSTLLDIMAQRKKCGTVGGEVLVRGQPIHPRSFRRMSAYVQQEDLLWPYLTVKESISYAAQLRAPASMTHDALEAHIQHIMNLLGIDHVQHSLVGSELVRGISGGEKKRCAIAMELVSEPLLLFLDEPTTGLDTFTALHLLTVLKEIAARGVAVVLSIHQPRASIFELFDNLLLLTGRGEQAYFGPACAVMPLLASVGITPSPADNLADVLLDAVSIPPKGDVCRSGLVQSYTQTALRTSTALVSAFRISLIGAVEQEMDAINQGCNSRFCRLGLDETPPYCRSVVKQIRVEAWRAVLSKVRDPDATVAYTIAAAFFGLVIGSVYFQLNNDQLSIRDRMGSLFFIAMNVALSCLGSLNLFIEERAILMKEHRAGMYCVFAYYVGKIVQDVPVTIITNLIFNVIVYFMMGLQNDVDKFFIFVCMCTLVVLNSYFLCLFVSGLSKNIQVANILAPLVLVLFLLPSGGVLMGSEDLPFLWRWLKYVSFVRYGLAGLVVNEFDGLEFLCKPVTPFCFQDGAAYAKTQGYFPEDLPRYIMVCAASLAVYVVLAFLSLFVRATYLL